MNDPDEEDDVDEPEDEIDLEKAVLEAFEKTNDLIDRLPTLKARPISSKFKTRKTTT